MPLSIRNYVPHQLPAGHRQTAEQDEGPRQRSRTLQHRACTRVGIILCGLLGPEKLRV